VVAAVAVVAVTSVWTDGRHRSPWSYAACGGGGGGTAVVAVLWSVTKLSSSLSSSSSDLSPSLLRVPSLDDRAAAVVLRARPTTGESSRASAAPSEAFSGSPSFRLVQLEKAVSLAGAGCARASAAAAAAAGRWVC